MQSRDLQRSDRTAQTNQDSGGQQAAANVDAERDTRDGDAS